MAASNAPAMVIVMIVCGVVSLIFMLLRFYSKLLLSKKLGLDDAFLGTSWVLFTIFIVISIYATKFGLGAHLADIDLTLLPELLYFVPIGQFFAVIAVAVSKSSFILTLLRLVTKQWQKAALWFMFATINASMLSISIVQFYQCSVPATPGCVNGDAVIGLGVFAAGYSAVLDLILTSFPSLVIWNLQMQRKEKAGIIISMSLGVVAGVVGIYKTYTIPNVSRSADFTYGTAIVLIWLVAEVSATIIASSIPFFRPLIRKFQTSSMKTPNETYGMKSRSRTGHSKLGSQIDLDDKSDRSILAPKSNIMRKTNITVVSEIHTDDEERGIQGQRHGQRDIF